MFSDEELELIEEILTMKGPDHISTAIEGRLLESILSKIDLRLNGA